MIKQFNSHDTVKLVLFLFLFFSLFCGSFLGSHNVLNFAMFFLRDFMGEHSWPFNTNVLLVA